MKEKTHKAKKSLGQNFLKSVPALNAIINAGEVIEKDTVLEIGPGKGALTEKLLEKAGKVNAIEKDRDLLEILQEKFKNEIKNKKLVLINEDILEYKVEEKNYKIIANIPYNITGAILKKFLTAENQPERMVLMVQHEVAKRIVARGGDESILSISVKAYGNPKIIMKVPARYFSPAPKVDSAIIAITDISRKTFKENKIDEEKFWELVKTGFAHKRKVLVSNLKDLYGKEKISEVFKNLNISEKTRAEELTLENWIAITKMV
ncbi:MAG: 16S rRNA (adenine(1518)-N(6)/adenine(1519)-N(6))-dimethyltransferase RsmA [Patescibacteria group bacterium]